MRHTPRPHKLIGTVGLVLLAGLLYGQPVRAAPVPTAYRIRGSGFGHGIGMSQYGAYGMALRGQTAGQILAHYYGGATARPAALPPRIRVGLLQANLDPSTGGRLDQVLVRGLPVPGDAASDGQLTVTGRSRNGGTKVRVLAGGVTWAIRPQAGGSSVFDPDGRLVFGPTTPGAGVAVGYRFGPPRPSLLWLPQASRLLRWGRLDVHLVRDGQRLRQRAVGVMSFATYLRGLAEMPGSWPTAALEAQAIAARSYALAAVTARGQFSGAARSDGCDCGVYSDVRDQYYLGYAKERGTAGARWVAAVAATGSKVVSYGGRVVMAYYSSSSGGWTASNAMWGSAPLAWYPSVRDPDDAAGGLNPNATWTVELSAVDLRARLARYGIGAIRQVRILSRPAAWGYRVATVAVTDADHTVNLTGAQIRSALGLKSTRYTIQPLA